MKTKSSRARLEAFAGLAILATARVSEDIKKVIILGEDVKVVAGDSLFFHAEESVFADAGFEPCRINAPDLHRFLSFAKADDVLVERRERSVKMLCGTGSAELPLDPFEDSPIPSIEGRDEIFAEFSIPKDEFGNVKAATTSIASSISFARLCVATYKTDKGFCMMSMDGSSSTRVFFTSPDAKFTPIMGEDGKEVGINVGMIPAQALMLGITSAKILEGDNLSFRLTESLVEVKVRQEKRCVATILVGTEPFSAFGASVEFINKSIGEPTDEKVTMEDSVRTEMSRSLAYVKAVSQYPYIRLNLLPAVGVKLENVVTSDFQTHSQNIVRIQKQAIIGEGSFYAHPENISKALSLNLSRMNVHTSCLVFSSLDGKVTFACQRGFEEDTAQLTEDAESEEGNAEANNLREAAEQAEQSATPREEG